MTASWIAPLPESVRTLLDKNTHPGLALDKYAKSLLLPAKDKASKDAGGKGRDDETGGKWQEMVQKRTCKEVVRLSGTAPEGLDFDSLLKCRKNCLESIGAVFFTAKTAGPLTLHLSRASALENAGICLHFLYGFAYLPGSGLKGMARAFAKTVWLPAQPDWVEAKKKILSVFGNEPGEPKQERQHAGAVVFHDAWPTSWPQLFVDIVNCHHSEYYGADRKDNEHAPGDWENPRPVYFLAVRPGQEFSFAVSKRRGDLPDELVALACEWLVGALTHEGAGAKTAAGYGAFRLVEGGEEKRRALTAAQATGDGAKKKKARAEFAATLELVTPAFLAGADQQQEDCDLRPATLRGLLRWWWRTMHAGWVDVATLRAMEAAVWGDTNTGGAVRVTVERVGNWEPEPYDKRSKASMTDQQKKSEHGIPDCEPHKTTQGLWYASYGMDESTKERTKEKTKERTEERRKQRCFVPPGAKWTVRLVARDGFYLRPEAKEDEKPLRIKSELILEQAKAALWLLCRFGGVGSKSRKGFGSFADIEETTITELEDCMGIAEKFRQMCGVKSQRVAEPESPSIDHVVVPNGESGKKRYLEIETEWRDPWHALDQVGFSMETFAQRLAHDPAKEVLGLPRKIHGPLSDGPLKTKDGRLLQDPKTWKKPEWLGVQHPKRRQREPENMREASPVHYHLARRSDGALVVRVIAFPSKYLPEFGKSREVLTRLVKHLETDLERRSELQPLQRATAPSGIRPAQKGHRGERMSGTLPQQKETRPAAPAKRPYGTPVKVKILGRREKGGYRVQEAGRPEGILNLGKVPEPPPAEGAEVDVFIHDDAIPPQYTWDAPSGGVRSDKRDRRSGGRPGGPDMGRR